MVGSCSLSHFKFPLNLSSPEAHDFGKCAAGHKEIHLPTLNLSASAVSPQLKAETTKANVDMRDSANVGGDAATNLHEFNDSTSEKQPADLLNFQCELYAFGGMPGPQYGPCLYYTCNHRTSYSPDTNTENGNCESTTRLIVSSLEDEFYVDAGIQIPQQLATSGFTPLPSRIPNLREILFRNRSTLSSTNVQNISEQEMKTDSEVSSDARDGSLQSKPNFSATHKVAAKPSSVSAASKSSVSVNTTTKKASVPGHMNRRNSGVLSDTVDCQTQQTSRGKMNVSYKQNPGVNITVVNRQQNYMEKDKAVKIKSSDINSRKKGSGMSENKKGSCVERLQVTALDDGAEKHNETYTVHKLNTRSQNLSEAKLSTTTFTNRRHSYSSVVQNNRSNGRDVALIKRGAASNCHSIGPEADKSVFNSQSHIKRGTSLDREPGSDVTVKRRSMVTPSAVKHTAWRHSSLERDSMDRLTLQTQGQAKSINKMVDVNKMECSRNTQRELHSLVDDVGSGSKGSNTSRIPRGGGGGGGGRSCHSSPGNSRASSPTFLGCSNSRLHQRTAPNSRASSPTRAEKLQQRLSVGSLSYYLGSMKLPESGTSRLPVR